MTSMTKFVDANIIIKSWSDEASEKLIDRLTKEEHATSVLALAEAYHKLEKKGIRNLFGFFREVLAGMEVFDITLEDFFNAIKNDLPLSINDRLHIEAMKRNDVRAIISYDKDFDHVSAIKREEP